MEKKINHLPLKSDEIIQNLSKIDIINSKIGKNHKKWEVIELSGGNLNQVNLVRGEKGVVCVKQSLPYLRILGPEARMPLNRLVYEHNTLCKHKTYISDFIPKIFYFDSKKFLLIFQYFENYKNLREMLILKSKCNFLSNNISSYLARTIFFSSDLYLKSHERRTEAARMAGNWGMFKWMEELSYTDPFIHNPRNNWNSPYLDKVVEELKKDSMLKLNVSILKEKYMSNHQTLVHGDLHSDSILIGKSKIGIIDYEHSFYGPYGYDFGHYYGHMFLNYFSQIFNMNETKFLNYDKWILSVIEDTWIKFVKNFSELWTKSRKGDAYSIKILDPNKDKYASNLAKDKLIKRCLKNALGFTGIEMIRRIVTVGQVDDLEKIKNPYDRYKSEIKCIEFGKYLIINFQEIESIYQITKKAEEIYINDNYKSF